MEQGKDYVIAGIITLVSILAIIIAVALKSGVFFD